MTANRSASLISVEESVLFPKRFIVVEWNILLDHVGYQQMRLGWKGKNWQLEREIEEFSREE